MSLSISAPKEGLMLETRGIGQLSAAKGPQIALNFNSFLKILKDS